MFSPFVFVFFNLSLVWDLTLNSQVPNYLPSISASISLSPECHIWRFCIGLHSAPRLLVAFTYFKFYKTRFASKFPESLLSRLNLAFALTENLGLLLLTYVSSSETFCEWSVSWHNFQSQYLLQEIFEIKLYIFPQLYIRKASSCSSSAPSSTCW